MATLRVRDMRFPSRSLRSVMLCRAGLRDRLYDRQLQGLNPPEMVGYWGHGGKYVARKAGVFLCRYLGFRGTSISEGKRPIPKFNYPR